jgi:amidohydrolase
MNQLIQQFENQLTHICVKAISYRKYLHSRPELSGHEVETSAFVERTLKEAGFDNIKRYDNYGVAALLQSDKNNKTIGIRAEMDALPIDEHNDNDYASKNKGVMHACGHDVHMGILLALAEFFMPLKEVLPVNIKFIFQPSEETLPGGAIALIDEGVLTEPDVDHMLGLHVLPELDAGKVGLKAGNYMASSDEIFINLRGKGGHAAMPHLLNDPVVCAAQIINSLQQVVSRKASPEIPSVLSFGRFIANGRTNVIPDLVEIEGTFRTFDETWRTNALQFIIDIATNLANSSGVDADVKIVRGYPMLKNNTQLTEQVKNILIKNLGDDHVVDLPIRMTADDFAYFSHKVPSCYFRIGTKDPKNNSVKQLHTSLFDIHDDAIKTGIKALGYCFMSGV